MTENYEYELTPVANVSFSGVVADEINRLHRELKKAESERDQWKRICDIIVVCILEMCDDHTLWPTANLDFALRDYQEYRNAEKNK